MKEVTCSDLGGPATCDVVIVGVTAEEMGENCKKHVMEQVQAGDAEHQAAIHVMMGLPPEEQQKKFAEYLQVCEVSIAERNA